MELKRTRQLLPLVEWRDSVGSTNAALRELCAREGDAVPHGTLVATANQVSGRGRLGRGWQTPPDVALAASILVRGFGDAGAGSDALPLSWLPLMAASAVTATLQPLFGFDGGMSQRVGVKWPNDVHVRDEEDAMAGRPGRKLCGILCEIVPAGNAVIVGMGINLLIPDEELPTDRATSVLAAGGDVEGLESLAGARGNDFADRILAAVARELLVLCETAGTRPAAVRRRVLRDSLTIGAEVRVHLPDGKIVDGRARHLDEGGALAVDLPTGGELVVSAADVEHLR